MRRRVLGVGGWPRGPSRSVGRCSEHRVMPPARSACCDCGLQIALCSRREGHSGLRRQRRARMKTGSTAVERNRRRVFLAILTIVASMFAFGEVRVAQASTSALVKNVVLVHGGFVDGSGWEGVYSALKRDGYTVSIVQNPTTSLADDVAVTKRAIAAQNGPVILVGHSYGGAVITEAGNDPKVAGLVYIAAFAPDKGESVSSLIKDPPPGAPVPPILPPVDGFLMLDRAKFPASFSGHSSPDVASFMPASQVPW